MIKKITLLSLVTALSFSSFAQEGSKKVACTTYEQYLLDVANDPEYAKNQQKLEEETREFVKKFPAQQRGSHAVKIIPIVFHIFHTYGPENISRDRVLEQIEILNKDYRRLNTDTNETNPIYKSIAVDCEVEFRLATIDPDGNPTDGVVRYYTPLTFNANTNVKALSAWPNNKYMNIWVVETIEPSASTNGTVLGRSQFPGGNNATDGILLKASVCGNTSTFNNYGRTLTHEMGHSFNLRHIWGDAQCGSDGVDDTPTHFDSNDGCPVNKTNNCNGVMNIEMVENYMDYTDGVCQNMFSSDQNDRMQATLNSVTNGRNNLWTGANLLATGTEDGHVAALPLPKADFYTNRIACVNDVVEYKDNSWRGPANTWKWTFEGGTPALSNDTNPTVIYAAPGVYKVKLVVTNAAGSDSTERASYITVLDGNASKPFPYSVGAENADVIGTDIFPISDDNTKWERTTAAAYSGTASAFLKVFGVPAGELDVFYLPPLNLTGVSGATMKFKLAHARRNNTTSEELKISITKNCGATYFLKYNKAGASLATTNNVLGNFTPSSTAQWREETVNLANIQNYNGGLVKFEALSGGGNNIYIDDIEISGTVTGVENLLMNNINMSIAPNPFNLNTQVSFFLISDAQVSLKVYDLLGKEVAVIAQNDNLRFGQHSYEINAANAGITEAGIYFVKLSVNGFEKSQKILLTK